MAMLYGFDLSDQKIDYFTRLSEIATSKLVESMIPGAAVVDALPCLRHIPAWFPGAQFRRHAAYVKKHADVMLEAPMKVVTEQTVSGSNFGMFSEYLAVILKLDAGMREEPGTFRSMCRPWLTRRFGWVAI